MATPETQQEQDQSILTPEARDLLAQQAVQSWKSTVRQITAAHHVSEEKKIHVGIDVFMIPTAAIRSIAAETQRSLSGLFHRGYIPGEFLTDTDAESLAYLYVAGALDPMEFSNIREGEDVETAVDPRQYILDAMTQLTITKEQEDLRMGTRGNRMYINENACGAFAETVQKLLPDIDIHAEDLWPVAVRVCQEFSSVVSSFDQIRNKPEFVHLALMIADGRGVAIA